MKTITRNGELKRIKDSEADLQIKQGWKFCKKSEWKIKVRDFNKNIKKETDSDKIL